LTRFLRLRSHFSPMATPTILYDTYEVIRELGPGCVLALDTVYNRECVISWHEFSGPALDARTKAFLKLYDEDLLEVISVSIEERDEKDENDASISMCVIEPAYTVALSSLLQDAVPSAVRTVLVNTAMFRAAIAINVFHSFDVSMNRLSCDSVSVTPEGIIRLRAYDFLLPVDTVNKSRDILLFGRMMITSFLTCISNDDKSSYPLDASIENIFSDSLELQEHLRLIAGSEGLLLLMRCISSEPKDRPTADQICSDTFFTRRGLHVPLCIREDASSSPKFRETPNFSATLPAPLKCIETSKHA
jgi:hypothetical protein